MLICSLFRLAALKSRNVRRNPLLLAQSPVNTLGGFPLSPPLVVCVVWLVAVGAMAAPICAVDMVCGTADAGGVLTGMDDPEAAAASILGRIGVWGESGCLPLSVAIWCSPPAITSSAAAGISGSKIWSGC